MDEHVFNENLLLTQAYCELQLESANNHVAGALRSFNPQYGGKDMFSYRYKNGFTTQWDIDPIFDSKHLYNRLFDKQIAHKRETLGNGDTERRFEGKILVAEIDLTFVDGVSQAESAGLIDANDCPPIDTWFYMSKNKSGRVLYAWIPQKFVPLANKAIAVNCVNCMHWHDAYFLSAADNTVSPKLQIKSVWTNFVYALKTTFV